MLLTRLHKCFESNSPVQVIHQIAQKLESNPPVHVIDQIVQMSPT